jgi:DNA mismatch endonuclease, patch repair protein
MDQNLLRDRRSGAGRPPASSPDVSRRMQTQARRDTAVERALRSALHKQGLRFRIHRRPVQGLRREADIVFPPVLVAVFVDGCFWHGCPIHASWPKQNSAWWREKIETNRRRDAETDQLLGEAGWLVLRFWEHEDPDEAAETVVDAVASRRAQLQTELAGIRVRARSRYPCRFAESPRERSAMAVQFTVADEEDLQGLALELSTLLENLEDGEALATLFAFAVLNGLGAAKRRIGGPADLADGHLRESFRHPARPDASSPLRLLQLRGLGRARGELLGLHAGSDPANGGGQRGIDPSRPP